MTAFRLIPLPVHGALELLTGVCAMVAPFVFGFEPAATVIAVVVGSTMVGLAFAAASPPQPDDTRAPLPIAAHHAADYGISLGLMLAAAVVALDGDAAAGAVLSVIALLQLSLSLATKYSIPSSPIARRRV